jgi:hypothetical protein
MKSGGFIGGKKQFCRENMTDFVLQYRTKKSKLCFERC